MKNLILFFFLTGTTSLFSQNPSELTFTGGLWVGLNKSTTFVGFVASKFSATFPISPKTKLEIALNGIPGTTVNKNPKFGLAIGSTIVLRPENWKIKPVIGVAVLKTDRWQTIYGFGFLF